MKRRKQIIVLKRIQHIHALKERQQINAAITTVFILSFISIVLLFFGNYQTFPHILPREMKDIIVLVAICCIILSVGIFSRVLATK